MPDAFSTSEPQLALHSEWSAEESRWNLGSAMNPPHPNLEGSKTTREFNAPSAPVYENVLATGQLFIRPARAEWLAFEDRSGRSTNTVSISSAFQTVHSISKSARHPPNLPQLTNNLSSFLEVKKNNLGINMTLVGITNRSSAGQPSASIGPMCRSH